MINESKKPYVKPELEIISVPAGMDLSNIDIEEVIKAHKNNKNDNDKNIIDVE